MYIKLEAINLPDNILTESDVYKIALTNELHGASFYASMAAKCKENRTKDIFHKLSEEEKEHHKLFKNLLEQAQNSPTKGSLKTETASYLKKLLHNSVFPSDTGASVAQISPQQALAMGIQAEKDAILIYHELYAHTDNDSVKEMLSKLLQEEKMHLVELRNELEEMQSSTS